MEEDKFFYGCPAGMKWRGHFRRLPPHQRQGQVREARLRRLHLPDDEGDAGGEARQAVPRVAQEHLLDGRAVAWHRGRIQGQEHKRMVAGLPGVGPNQGERR